MLLESHPRILAVIGGTDDVEVLREARECLLSYVDEFKLIGDLESAEEMSKLAGAVARVADLTDRGR